MEQQVPASEPNPERIFTRNFTFACLGVLSFFLTFFLFFPPLPVFIEAHGGKESLIGALVGGASIAGLLQRPFSGRLVDRFGRRPFLTIGMVMLAMSSIGYDFIVVLPMFWVMRVMAGSSVGLYTTALMAHVGDTAPAAHRGRALGYIGTFNTVGIALGPLLGSWLMSSGTFREIEQSLRRWLPGNGSDVTNDYNFATIFVVAFLISGFGILSTRFLKDTHVPVKLPKQPLKKTIAEVFEKSAFVPASVQTLMVTNFVALNIFMPLYGLDLNLPNIGIYYTCYAGAVVAVRLLAGRLLDRYPRVMTLAPCLGIMVLGSVLLGIIQEQWMVPLGGAIIGLGHGMVQPALQALAVDRAPKQRLGTAMATYNLGTDIGLGAGGFIMGLVLQATNFSTFFIVAGLMSGLAIVALLSATMLAGGARQLQTPVPSTH